MIALPSRNRQMHPNFGIPVPQSGINRPFCHVIMPTRGDHDGQAAFVRTGNKYLLLSVTEKSNTISDFHCTTCLN
jgi:hypothetical protein